MIGVGMARGSLGLIGEAALPMGDSESQLTASWPEKAKACLRIATPSSKVNSFVSLLVAPMLSGRFCGLSITFEGQPEVVNNHFRRHMAQIQK